MKFIEKYSDKIKKLELEFKEPGMDIYGLITLSENLISSHECSLSEHVWETCNKELILNEIKNVINNKINLIILDNKEYRDNMFTNLVIENLIDDENNIECIYDKIYNMVVQEIELKVNNNIFILGDNDNVNVHKIEI